jgi:hypothetical protein
MDDPVVKRGAMNADDGQLTTDNGQHATNNV